jgi:hypothetical protein
MKTNDQLAAIGGDNVFDFETTIGQGIAPVLVRMSYEFDSTGTYNETIDSVRTMARLNITDYLEDSTLDDLAMTGCRLLNTSFTIED